MTIDHHRDAEALMERGDRAAAQGELDLSRALYFAAAEADALAFHETTGDRPRTRGVLGLSSVALYRRAGRADEATRQAHAVLGAGAMAAEWEREIEMVLDELRTERLAGLYPDANGLQWALRGGRIGFGVARSETVTQKIDQVQRLAWRTFEMLTGRDVRTNQPASEEVRRAVDLLVTQPVAGSFTFGVRLADHQLTLDDDALEQAAVTKSIYAILVAAQAEDDETLSEAVPDPAYRDVFLRLVRNISPDGKEIGEIEIRAIGGSGMSTVLRPEARVRIRRRLPRLAPPTGAAVAELRDVLRVIDLNRRRIALGTSGHEQPCIVPPDLALVDLIEGLEDRRVRVTGHWQGKSFVVHDIERDDDEE